MTSRKHADFELEAGRFGELHWTAFADDASTPIAFAAGDDVLWKIGATEGGTPLVDLVRVANANGSQVVIDEFGDTSDPDPDNWVTASGRVLIDQHDTAVLATTKPVVCYDELLLKDSADGDRLKTITRGRVQVKPSQS